MKKMIFIVSLVALAACGDKTRTYSESEVEQQRDSLQRIINDKDSELNDIMSTFSEVQDGIRRISEAEGRVTVADGNLESASNKEIVMENMRFIQESMEQNRQLIEQLKGKLKASTFNAEKLQKTIEGLQAQVEAQAARIQELEASLAEKDIQLHQQGEEIVNLNNNVASLTEENKQQSETMASQDKDLNTAWYVFGTKRELEHQKILVGGQVLKSADFATDYFTKVDIRQKKEIKFYSKSAKMLTSHPAGSYVLQKNDKGEYELYITDAKKFWSVSKYLVVQVK